MKIYPAFFAYPQPSYRFHFTFSFQRYTIFKDHITLGDCILSVNFTLPSFMLP